MTSCEMKGFLSFLIVWMLGKKSMTGAELALELERRKGNKPSPGTIYPALKYLKDKGLITMDKNKSYSLTAKGKKERQVLVDSFFQTFSDIDEMRKCCGKH